MKTSNNNFSKKTFCKIVVIFRLVQKPSEDCALTRSVKTISNLNNSKTLPIMYWIPKIHKNPTSARFINASKIYSTKQIISKSASNVFKLMHFQNC